MSKTNPDPIFQMLTGFWVSKTMMSAVEMEVFSKMEGKKVTMQEFKRLLGLESRPADVFASALVSLGLLEIKDGSLSNSPIASAFLAKQNPAYMGEIVRMFDERLYKGWDLLTWSLANNKPVDAQKGGGGESLFDDAKQNRNIKAMVKFTHAMHGVSIDPAMALTRVYDFSKHTKMMDIGDGSGVYAIHVVKENPGMTATILDLEAVCGVAQEYVVKYGLEDRISTRPTDFFKDDLPSGHDVAFLSHILHDYDVGKGISLLKKVHSRLTDGGVVIISEWMLNDSKTGPIPAALMGLNMIVETNGGRNYSFVEIADMLKQAGFKNPEKRSLAGPAEIAIGYKK